MRRELEGKDLPCTYYTANGRLNTPKQCLLRGRRRYGQMEPHQPESWLTGSGLFGTRDTKPVKIKLYLHL